MMERGKIYYQEPKHTIYCGHALDILREMLAESVDMCITSPPYWGLRTYKTEPIIWGDDCEHEWGKELNGRRERTNGDIVDMKSKEATKSASAFNSTGGNFCLKCNAWKGELGLEPTIELYIQHLILIFNEVKRVLKKTGTCWVNIDDSYAGGQGSVLPDAQRDIALRTPVTTGIQSKGIAHANGRKVQGVPAKSLCLIPQRFAIAMVNDESGDIYELDNRFILCNNKNVTEDITHAVQRQGKRKAIPQGIQETLGMAKSAEVQGLSAELEEIKSRESEAIQSEVLLGEQGEGDSALHQGQCQTAQDIEASGIDSLWGEPTEMPMLRGTQDTISDDTPYRRQWCSTQASNQEYRFDIRVAKEGEVPTRLRDFMHELQWRIRILWFLPPSRGKNLRLRKSDIPLELAPYFHLVQQECWLVRNDIVWNKPNPMPESVKDRFTGSWEHLFFFVKSKKYWFEQQFEPLIPHSENNGPKSIRKLSKTTGYVSIERTDPSRFEPMRSNPNGRNKRDVWGINTQPYPEAHFATFPEKLCETPILAGCPSMLCKKCGKAREKVYKTETEYKSYWGKQRKTPEDVRDIGKYGQTNDAMDGDRKRTDFDIRLGPVTRHEQIGYTDCGCNAGYESGVVLDPFTGSGTSQAVAKRLGRKSIGIDLNPDYCKLGMKRLQSIPLVMEL